MLSVVSAKLIVGKPAPVSAATPTIELVRIVVKTTPASAEVLPTGEGVEVKGWRPFSLAAKKDGPPITLRIKAEGYKEETRTVEPTSDQTLNVDLSKLVEEAPPIQPPETASTPGKKKKGDKGDKGDKGEPKKTETKVADTAKDVKPAKGTEPAKDPKPGKSPDPVKDKEPKADKTKDTKPAGDTKRNHASESGRFHRCQQRAKLLRIAGTANDDHAGAGRNAGLLHQTGHDQNRPRIGRIEINRTVHGRGGPRRDRKSVV